MTRRAAWSVVIAVAAVAALSPLPEGAVERWYSRGLFPHLQRALTSGSNLVPFALFDVLWIGAIAAAVIACFRLVRAHGWRAGLLRTSAVIASRAALVYVAFLAAWGLNYRRVPLIEKVAFDPARVTRSASTALGEWAVSELNASYAAAHATRVPLDRLHAAFEEAHAALGGAPIVPGRPKGTVLGWYFHKASIAGMTDPFLLETLLAPDLLDVERPFVVAHEWAHLAGYADESEASFVAYLACRRGESGARYSGALALIGYARPARPLDVALDIGPRTDLAAIRARYAQTSRPLRTAARESYDKYLKANRVERGIESYDAVVQLILGTELDRRGNPRLR